MLTLEAWVRTPVSEALGWALFHSLWQGALAAALLAVLSARRSAGTRYLGGCAALLAIGLSFSLTFWLALPSGGPVLTPRGISAPMALLAASSGTQTTIVRHAGDLLAWLTPFWLAGVVFFQMRMAGGWLGTMRLRRRGLCDVPGTWKNRLAELAAPMRVLRPVQLLESSLAGVPIVVGHLRPMILVPAGLMASLPPEQIEAILLHELAHIRRHDYLVNLMQSFVEGLFFYHPAVWWISGFVRAEREYCCDDLAVAASARGGAYQYALALAALEQSRCGDMLANRNESAAFVAATGGSLMKGIHRLLHPAAHRTPAAGWAVAPLILIVALASGVALADAAAPQPQPDPDPYLKWVNEDVVYIIEVREREAFLRLETNDERKRFIEQFWLRRATADTPADKVKAEHYRRIAYSNERYASGIPGWKTDRGRIYIVYGPPDEIESHPSGRGGGPPSEHWLYAYLEGIGRRVIVEFVDGNRNGDYRQTTDPANRN